MALATMRLARQSSAGFILAIALWSLTYDISAATAAGVEPMITNRPLFSIPFFLNTGRDRPTHVHLFVSGSKGARWLHYQERTAEEQRFDFRAGEDGTYWFVVRTDRERNRPTKDTPPEKIVVVDQTQPKIDLTVSSTPRGDLKASWLAEDLYIDPTTFHLEYRVDDGDWQRVVTADPRSFGDEANRRLAGNTEWSVAVGAIQVDVRAEILDRAGNSSVATRSVALQQAASPIANQPNDQLLQPTPEKSSVDTTSVQTSTPDLPPPGSAGLARRLRTTVEIRIVGLGVARVYA